MGRRILGSYVIIGRKYHPDGTSTAIAVWHPPAGADEIMIDGDPIPAARVVRHRQRRRR